MSPRPGAAHLGNMKVYHESHAFLDRAVIAALGDNSHHRQAGLYVVAKTKKAAVEALAASGMPDHVAASHGREMRMVTAPYPTEFRNAVDSDAIDLDVEGIYVFSANHGENVVRLDADSTTVVGHNRYDPVARRRVVVPVNQES